MKLILALVHFLAIMGFAAVAVVLIGWAMVSMRDWVAPLQAWAMRCVPWWSGGPAARDAAAFQHSHDRFEALSHGYDCSSGGGDGGGDCGGAD